MTKAPVPAAEAPAQVATASWKTTLAYAVFTVAVALLPLLGPRTGETTFRLAADTDLVAIPDVTVPANLTTWLLVGAMVVLTAASAALTVARRRTPLLMTVAFAVVAVVAFLCWSAAGATMPVLGLLSGALALAVPLVFGALGGVLGERAGVVNIAIDGQLLFGAFAAAMFGTVFATVGGDVLGLAGGVVAAMLTGALVAALLAVFTITYYVDQVIVGVVLNVLAVGVTSFLFSQVMTSYTEQLNSPPRFPRLPIPLLGEIPVVGPIFFRQTALVYAMYVAVALVAWALFRTKWGLRVRAVGEHPKAADTVGINVNRTRYRTVLLAGLIAGAGGATYTLVSVSQFNREMTGGAGYIALAAVIFGKWHPLKATLAALLFGFAQNLQGALSAVGSPVPSQFMLMLPYVVTILAVAGLVGRSRGPAASGVPYVK